MQKYKKTLIQRYSCLIFLLSLHKFTVGTTFKHLFRHMKQSIKYTILLMVIWAVCVPVLADDYPTVSPSVTFTTADGTEQTTTSFSGSAPIKAHCTANPENVGDWDCYYEWRVFHASDTTAYIIRYEEDTDLEFNESGTHTIQLYARFTRNDETLEFDTSEDPFTVTISESNLEMPNAFSPNGDGINDQYKAKSGYQSITEFHASIFNRWGQKLYEWDDPAGYWDGTYKGKTVKDGVYFVLVKAKGADGKVYNIKRDVNVITGHNSETTSTGE